MLGNTYIFFTSDNGFDGATIAYEGQVVAPTRRTSACRSWCAARCGGRTQGPEKLVLNTDYLPTFTDLAGTKTPGYVDGRSLGPSSRVTRRLEERRFARSPRRAA